MKEVIKHASSGGFVLGICNGFQILTETGLLPGSLLRNQNLKFICKHVNLIVKNNKTSFTNCYAKLDKITIPIAHNEGNYYANKNTLRILEDNDQIVFQYCDENYIINNKGNPNGSSLNIAGIINKNKNVLGMMPHPERSVENFLNKDDGINFFESLLK